jgi:hypothetical protein
VHFRGASDAPAPKPTQRNAHAATDSIGADPSSNFNAQNDMPESESADAANAGGVGGGGGGFTGRVRDLGVGAHLAVSPLLLTPQEIRVIRRGPAQQAASAEPDASSKAAARGKASSTRVSAQLQALLANKSSAGASNRSSAPAAAAIARDTNETAPMGLFASHKSPLAAFRAKKALEGGKLDDSVRDLLDSLCSVERFTDKNAVKTGVTLKAVAAGTSAFGAVVASSSSSSSSEHHQQNASQLANSDQHELENEAAESFVPERLKVLSALFIAELLPQLKFMPAEERMRLQSLCEGDSRGHGVNNRNSKVKAGGAGDHSSGNGSAFQRRNSTLATPQNRKIPRVSEIEGMNGELGIGAQTPGLAEIITQNKGGRNDATAATAAGGFPEMPSLLPPLSLALCDLCMDGLTSADMVLFFVEWATQGMGNTAAAPDGK